MPSSFRHPQSCASCLQWLQWDAGRFDHTLNRYVFGRFDRVGNRRESVRCRRDNAYSADNVLLTTRVVESGGIPILTPTPPPSIFSTSMMTDESEATAKQYPDDLTTQGGEGRAFTDDLQSRPIIPQVSLIGSVGNKFVIAEQQSIISVPSNLFEDSYPGAQLEFEARSPDGGSLPSWLEFDARNLTFSGTPPATSHGAVDVLIVARDQFGHEATASFRILVDATTRLSRI